MVQSPIFTFYIYVRTNIVDFYHLFSTNLSIIYHPINYKKGVVFVEAKPIRAKVQAWPNKVENV